MKKQWQTFIKRSIECHGKCWCGITDFTSSFIIKKANVFYLSNLTFGEDALTETTVCLTVVFSPFEIIPLAHLSISLFIDSNLGWVTHMSKKLLFEMLFEKRVVLLFSQVYFFSQESAFYITKFAFIPLLQLCSVAWKKKKHKHHWWSRCTDPE